MTILSRKDHSQKEIIIETLKVLKKGGLIIFPTETTYGAGVDATNAKAVEKLLQYKSKREGKPLSIAVHTKTMAKKYVVWNEQAEQLTEQFLPGPVTIVCTGKQKVAPGVESEFNTLGIRIPDYPLILDLIKEFKKPITATSANSSGKKRPYSIADIFHNISQKQKNLIDLVIDAGELPKNEPSTVIDTTLSTPLTLRGRKNQAMLPKENIEFVTLKSRSEAETQSIAGRLTLKHWNAIQSTGLVIGLDGELGMGKTIFTKGVARFLQIPQTITSPTYSYIEEYPYERHDTTGTLYHLDMWKVSSSEEFMRLQVSKLIKPSTVTVIEWYSQIEKELTPLLIQEHIPLIHAVFSGKDLMREIRLEEVL